MRGTGGSVIEAVSWDKNLADLKQAIRYQSRPSRRPLTMMAGVLGAALIAIPVVGSGESMPLAFVLFCGVFGGYLLLTALRPLLLGVSDAERALKRDPHLRLLLGRTAIAVTPDGFTVQTPIMTEGYTWLIVTEIERSAEAVVFKLGTMGAVLVPARAFESSDRMHEFSARATELLQEWRTRQQSVPHLTSAST